MNKFPHPGKIQTFEINRLFGSSKRKYNCKKDRIVRTLRLIVPIVAIIRVIVAALWTWYRIARYHEDIDTAVIQFVSTTGGNTWGLTNVSGGKATGISNIF